MVFQQARLSGPGGAAGAARRCVCVYGWWSWRRGDGPTSRARRLARAARGAGGAPGSRPSPRRAGARPAAAALDRVGGCRSWTAGWSPRASPRSGWRRASGSRTGWCGSRVNVVSIGRLLRRRGCCLTTGPLPAVPGDGVRRLPRRGARSLAPARVRPARVVLIGPECTGKTWLAGELAALYGVPWSREYAREYVERHGAAADATPTWTRSAAGRSRARTRPSRGPWPTARPARRARHRPRQHRGLQPALLRRLPGVDRGSRPRGGWASSTCSTTSTCRGSRTGASASSRSGAAGALRALPRDARRRRGARASDPGALGGAAAAPCRRSTGCCRSGHAAGQRIRSGRASRRRAATAPKAGYNVATRRDA